MLAPSARTEETWDENNLKEGRRKDRTTIVRDGREERSRLSAMMRSSAYILDL
jgi:hypothetical protein